ncbi:MAG: hypothetical protein H7Y18_00860 [Clostridiaceae bacterium]|nr:hypothetical protein [Clostridiaceae bacterium]
MEDELKELLLQMKSDIKDISIRLEKVEKNQINVANAEHKNWHMLADKLNEYDLVLHKIFGKKEN